ncbi:MAG: type V CRISPR-associated endonuclease Cas1 [Lachnospiraceae bacterium]|nr:type V CRISPR-associated endonuclease Cas1 [Lachnospiraceae bacterium]
MLERPDFVKKQIIFLFANRGEKISFKNDNIVVTDKEGKIKYQVTCYLVFVMFVVGDTSITSGIIRRAKKFGFVICMMTQAFKLYAIIGNRMEGNTLLHRKQYQYEQSDIAQFLVENKIRNQRQALNTFRKKSIANKEAIAKLDEYLQVLKEEKIDTNSLLGIEGSAARVYFPQMFDNVNWKGRKPRIKSDYINTTLDIGYNLLFNMVDSLLQVYGFDVYCGVYHKEFYMRKSLACDLMEPMRPMIDLTVRKGINLGQCKQDDFQVLQNQYVLNYKKSASYVSFLMNTILDNKEAMFLFIQQYYRAFMKNKDIEQYKSFEVIH